ncbi:hypothetical protein FC84_GL001593 [Lapidilactobacillus dextrinicus DSM 20335]|uniref:Bacteriophage Gp15 protein n=1 Tax=Lapidilactobacillus dextrinicus DSM 20335 TaxID=1423738 RepID=A0A0R2BSU0_9LACO|nr:Gp15 family bacteriophage protein [Lapidilactobacillus dextrinicus]KRM79417.1 hypothetical protein FC84_GL001593 [Lapidilactobacillus dextrinicus DSM 20335]QFG46750.1 hypothetical protein LH506_04500 [Lapidilactobacillus dextrinicus]
MLSLTQPIDDTWLDEETGEIYHFDMSYDNVLRWYSLVEEENISDAEKLVTGFQMFFGKELDVSIDSMIKAVEDIANYIQTTAYGNYNDSASGTEHQSEPEKYFSYSQDAGAIYSSFMMDYQIDLVDQQGILQWDKFRALFSGLSDKTDFKHIMRIRQANLTDYEGEQQTAMAEAQAYYALEGQNVNKLNDQMTDIFNGLLLQAKEAQKQEKGGK